MDKKNCANGDAEVKTSVSDIIESGVMTAVQK